VDPFVHLRVASGYSLQYGASHPHVLVERAAEQEMDTLALTDRDGTYGAVKFAQACRAAGIRPVLGVDLAYRPVLAGGPRSASRPRTPTRGGEFRDPTWDSLPRVTLLASAGGPGGGRAGWSLRCTSPATGAAPWPPSTCWPPGWPRAT
jgi:error-prone DNA polymerase